jgi:DNA-directed RNA polymerase specialized sigma24 family protein
VGVTVDQGSAGFREFVVARSASLARTAYLLTGDRQLAEDLVQEALTRVASRRPEGKRKRRYRRSTGVGTSIATLSAGK